MSSAYLQVQCHACSMRLFRTLLAINKVNKMDLYGDAKRIFAAAVESVQPGNLIKNCVGLTGNQLSVKENAYNFKKPCHVIGFGKAVLGMGLELERILSDNIHTGICIIPAGTCYEGRNSRIDFIEGATDNLPDLNALHGANRIFELCEGLTEDDFLIVLISGGGSALLPLPAEGITLEEKLTVIKELVKKGADILELNCVRKRLSRVKGGGLARAAHPARVVSLILSDVIGDPLDFIASGPTVMNSDQSGDALGVIKRHGLLGTVPEAALKILNSPDQPHGDYSHVDNFIIGNNESACSAAKIAAENLGYSALVWDTKIMGDVRDLGREYAKLTRLILERGLNELDYGKPVCVIGGGEPTVVLQGGGKGGRNQELALVFAQEVAGFAESARVGFLSCGTDGIDGPTDAAGAYGYTGLVKAALAENLNPDTFLRNNDSYNFYGKFRGGEFLHKTGHTGTNVMDVHVLLVK